MILPDTNWYSFFLPDEVSVINAETPEEILLDMKNQPKLALRFIHHLVANNEHQKALNVLLALQPNEERLQYVNWLHKQVVSEFQYYKDYSLPHRERVYHSLAIPLILALAEMGLTSFTDDGNNSKLRDIASKKAHAMSFKLLSMGLTT